ncbi:MAG TPA: family 20 glycosylhydrolase [Phycisphaerae bacterium]|nr:family 20 glycosylhydrolase [Phycisphaerae bacterium]
MSEADVDVRTIASSVLVLSLLACAASSSALADDRPGGLRLVPWPKAATMAEGKLELAASARIVPAEEKLLPLAKVLAEEFHLLTGRRLEAAKAKAGPGDVSLVVDTSLSSESYVLRVTDRAEVRGGSYAAAAMGTATLLQAMTLQDGKLTLPRMTIEDGPAGAYRGVLIDVARQWHSIDVLKQLVVMCRLYKINYVQLHLTDDQSFTFPSKAFPDLPTVSGETRRHYTLEELRDLVRFADERGVTLVPEFEGPGHAGRLRKVEPFGLKGVSVINMADEAVYKALDTLVGEMCDVFRSSPYFHIGADEAWLKGVGETDAEKAYMNAHGLSSPYELYCHYIVRMNEIVRRHGKRTIVWEGFHGDGSKAVRIPRDILVMPFESAYNRPDNLASLGYTLINTAWKPLYVVNNKRWPPRYIYESWNVRLWEHHVQRDLHIQLPETADVIGAQMCAWEQPEWDEVPSLRGRVPAMGERIWNPQAGRSYEDFDARWRVADDVLERLILPVSIDAKGLLAAGDNAFSDPLALHMTATAPGTIRYTLDGAEPTAQSPAYTGPVQLTAGHARKTGRDRRTIATVMARLFDADGQAVAYAERAEFEHITPKVRYRLYLPPKSGRFDALPDFDSLRPARTGYMGEFSSAVHDAPALGYGLVLEGRIDVPADGEYTLGIRTNDGTGQLFVDDRPVVTRAKGGWHEHDTAKVHLGKGPHRVRVTYCYNLFANYLSLTYQAADMKRPGGLSELLVPLAPAPQPSASAGG